MSVAKKYIVFQRYQPYMSNGKLRTKLRRPPSQLLRVLDNQTQCSSVPNFAILLVKGYS